MMQTMNMRNIATWIYALDGNSGNYIPMFKVTNEPFTYKNRILNEENSRFTFYQIERDDSNKQAELVQEFVMDIPGNANSPDMEIAFKSVDGTKNILVIVSDLYGNKILERGVLDKEEKRETEELPESVKLICFFTGTVQNRCYSLIYTEL